MTPRAWDAIPTGTSRCCARSPRPPRPGWVASPVLVTIPRDGITATEWTPKRRPGRRQIRYGEATRDFATVPAFDGDSLDADVAWELAALSSAGISEVVAVDLTREEFGIPVVRVIVPGLEGPVTTVPNCRLGGRAAELIGDR